MAKERIRERACELRKRAEIILAEDPQAIRTMVPADTQKLIHELNVHQIELEMQNAELRRVQLELQEARDKYLNLYDFAPTGYFTLDRNSLIVDVNLAGSELLGSEKHRLIGAQFTSSISPDSQDAFYFYYREVLKTGIKGNCELKMLKADGTPFHAQLISMAVPEKDGNINQCRTAVINITERKQAEELFRSLALNSPAGVYIVQKGKFCYTNPQFQEDTGYHEDELSGMESLSLVVPEDRETVRENAIQALKRKRVTPHEFRIINKNGDIRWALETVAHVLAEFDAQAREENKLSTLPCLKKDGTIIYADINAAKAIIDGRECNIGFFTDITERKAMEKELQKIDKLESVGTLAGGIAHDFNNLLTGILGNISLAKRYVEEKGEAFDRLVEAEKASLRARDLTQQLLTFAKGGTPIKKLVSMAGIIIESATLALTGSNVRSDFDLPDDLWAIEVDEGQMSQVINNIVLNAVQAMPQGGLVNISARNLVINKKGSLPLPKGNYIEVTIYDHGIGMPKDHLDRMFEPYFTTKQKGSGLGLATAYSIIKNHGGHIAMKSTPTAGTTVNVYLPAVKKRIPKQRGEESVQPSLVSQGRVLVMDDEEIIRLLLSKILTGTGYEVELSEDGAEAVELYRKARESGQPFDAVILDLTVPGGMEGKETIKKLLEIDPEAKVIVSSGYATDPIMSEYKKYGFSAVVAKPYSVSQMEETLHDVLANK